MTCELANIDELIESYDVDNDLIINKHFKEIESTLWSRIENYADTFNEYGTVMSQHLMRTSAIGQAFLTECLGFSKKAARNFYDANLLHDLGKTHSNYDESIWQLPHRPTEEEREEKRAHTRLGVEVLDLYLVKSPQELQEHPHIRVIQSLQQHHHERVDGTGYEGLEGNKLGKLIKAICILDAFDGDMIQRPHQLEQRTPEQALERLKTGNKYKGAFDEGILQRFIDFNKVAG